MKKEILLHICCAPDGTTAIERLKENYIVKGYYGNSNIHPLAEYLKRKEAVRKLEKYYNIEIIYGEYHPDEWLKSMEGLNKLPENGARCRKCIYGNMLETAKVAEKEGFYAFTTSLMTSSHKDVEWIKICGEAIQKKVAVVYHHEIFRKRNGFLNSVNRSKEIGLYRQDYCGCLFSMNHSTSL